MKKVLVLILVLIVIAGSGLLVYYHATTPGTEGIATLKTVKAKPSSTPPFNAYFIQKRVNVSRQKPDTITDLPSESASEPPLYFTFIINDANCPGVVHRGQKQWTIYTDTNLNGKLSDEKGLMGISHKVSRYQTDYIFGPVSFASSSLPTPIYFVYSGYSNIALFPAYYQTGKIRLGDTVYRVGILDGDYDGKYSTLFAPCTDDNYNVNCDIFAIDLNNDRTYNAWYYQTIRETLPLSRYFRHKDKIYEINISEQNHTLELKPSTPAMGKLKIGSDKDLECHLYSKTLSSAVAFTDELDLPAGDYSAYGGILEIKDSQGSLWKFIEGSLQESGALQTFTIAPSQTLEVTLGPPFVIKTRGLKIKDTMTFRPYLQGKGNETFSAHVYKNGKSQPEPTLKILNENGEEMHSGHMEYG